MDFFKKDLKGGFLKKKIIRGLLKKDRVRDYLQKKGLWAFLQIFQDSLKNYSFKMSNGKNMAETNLALLKIQKVFWEQFWNIFICWNFLY